MNKSEQLIKLLLDNNVEQLSDFICPQDRSDDCSDIECSECLRNWLGQKKADKEKLKEDLAECNKQLALLEEHKQKGIRCLCCKKLILDGHIFVSKRNPLVGLCFNCY